MNRWEEQISLICWHITVHKTLFISVDNIQKSLTLTVQKKKKKGKENGTVKKNMLMMMKKLIPPRESQNCCINQGFGSVSSSRGCSMTCMTFLGGAFSSSMSIGFAFSLTFMMTKNKSL